MYVPRNKCRFYDNRALREIVTHTETDSINEKQKQIRLGSFVERSKVIGPRSIRSLPDLHIKQEMGQGKAKKIRGNIKHKLTFR